MGSTPMMHAFERDPRKVLHTSMHPQPRRRTWYWQKLYSKQAHHIMHRSRSNLAGIRLCNWGFMQPIEQHDLYLPIIQKAVRAKLQVW